MLTKWRLPMLGVGVWLGVWLYLGVVGVLWGAVLSQHQKVVEHWHTYLSVPEAPPLPAAESPNPLHSPRHPTTGCLQPWAIPGRLGSPP